MDELLKEYLLKEEERQQNNIELIASENFASAEVREFLGSRLTNKYAEGLPKRRYYGGCQYIDEIESRAIEHAKRLFNCNYVNVQPHSGTNANLAAYRSLVDIGDKVMGMNLSHGGHLSHGHSLSFSGIDYEIIDYKVNKDTGLIDYDELEQIALVEKPKMIIAGASAYSRAIDFKRFREIADKTGAYLMVDMAHIAGLVAAGLHQSPIPYAHIVTSTTHKTLRGPRGGIILTNYEDIAKKVNRTVFPEIQGGPLENTIAAKGQCFYEALQPEFKEYQQQVINNAKTMSKKFIQDGATIVTGGTDNHLFLLDVIKSYNLTGKEAEKILDNINITVNKNTIPYDQQKPYITSGIRIGTPAMTTRGFKEKDFELVEYIINKSLRNPDNQQVQKECKDMVLSLTKKHPLI